MLPCCLHLFAVCVIQGPCVVYGSLPPEVKQEQAALFNDPNRASASAVSFDDLMKVPGTRSLKPTNIAPENGPGPNMKEVAQPSISMCYVGFKESIVRAVWAVLGKGLDGSIYKIWICFFPLNEALKKDEGVRCGCWEWVPARLAWSSLAFVPLREPKSRGICKVTRYSNTLLVFFVEWKIAWSKSWWVICSFLLLSIWRWQFRWRFAIRGFVYVWRLPLFKAPLQPWSFFLKIFWYPFANQRYIVFHSMFVHVNFRGMPEGIQMDPDEVAMMSWSHQMPLLWVA